MIIQRAKPKYIFYHLSLFDVNNRNEVVGFVGCQGFVCVHWVFRRNIIWVAHVTLSESSISSYPTWSAPVPTKLQKIFTFLLRLSSFLKMFLLLDHVTETAKISRA